MINDKEGFCLLYLHLVPHEYLMFKMGGVIDDPGVD